jgi:YD repeat-containing protein
LLFSYGGNGLISQVTDPLGNAFRYSYQFQARNTLANLASVSFPGGEARQYLYDEPQYSQAGSYAYGFLTGLVDELGSRFSTFQFDSSGAATATGHANGIDAYTFNRSGQNPVITDPLGATRTFLFASIAGGYRPTGISAPCPHCGAIPASIAYDANGNVSATTDFNQVQTRYTYDPVRNLELTRMEGIGACPANTTFYSSAYGSSCTTGTCWSLTSFPGSQSAQPLGYGGWYYSCASTAARTVSTQWHPTWRLPTRAAEPNRITTSTYNGDGGVYCAPTTATVNGQPIGVLCRRSVQATTDNTGQSGFAAPLTGAARTWQYTYDGYGQVLTATDPNGRITSTAYYPATDPDLGKRGSVQTVTNPAGHVTTFTAYDRNGRPTAVTDPNGSVTILTYHPRGWLTSRTVGGETTSFGYDSAGNLTKVTTPDGSSLSYRYDAAHRLVQIQDSLGNRTAYTLDAIGNRTREDAYDPAGMLARTRGKVFDSLNRLHQTVGVR